MKRKGLKKLNYAEKHHKLPEDHSNEENEHDDDDDDMEIKNKKHTRILKNTDIHDEYE